MYQFDFILSAAKLLTEWNQCTHSLSTKSTMNVYIELGAKLAPNSMYISTFSVDLRSTLNVLMYTLSGHKMWPLSVLMYMECHRHSMYISTNLTIMSVFDEVENRHYCQNRYPLILPGNRATKSSRARVQKRGTPNWHIPKVSFYMQIACKCPNVHGRTIWSSHVH